jgi:hypothetical protein
MPGSPMGRSTLVFMTTNKENDLLSHTGRGTPMGDLFRRFWFPDEATNRRSSGWDSGRSGPLITR